MLVFLMILHFLKLTTLSCFVLSALLSFLYLMLFLIACSLLWFHLVITISLSLMIRAPLKMLLLNTLSPLSVFPNVSKWVCREALFSLDTPGHLLSPHLFLNYRHVIEYLLYVRQTNSRQRTHLSQLWNDTLHLKWGPFLRLRSATKHLGFVFEDPFVLVIQNEAYSVDDDLCALKHTIRDSYRQFYLAKASQRRHDCSGQQQPIDVINTRAFYRSLQNPIHQSIMRHILTGSLDHTYRLYKSNLVSSPVCPHCNVCDETAELIFWYMFKVGLNSSWIFYPLKTF